MIDLYNFLGSQETHAKRQLDFLVLRCSSNVQNEILVIPIFLDIYKNFNSLEV